MTRRKKTTHSRKPKMDKIKERPYTLKNKKRTNKPISRTNTTQETKKEIKKNQP